MSLQLGDTAPDFRAETTRGRIDFHEWLGASWGLLFSHPRDFTPVCTTELGQVALLEPQFAERGVKLVGLSIDNVVSHEQWLHDIRDTHGVNVSFPIVADVDRSVATPARWRAGDDVIILPSIPDEEARERFPRGWNEIKPYLRMTPDPRA